MIATRVTEAFGIRHPIVSAPMAGAAGGRLAAAVSETGGLGLIGGGYGDADWIEAQFDAAGATAVGIGFIAWSVDRALVEAALDRRPAAVFLSFADPAPLAEAVLAAGVPLIVQVQTADGARRALDAGASMIVAQGGEAGGHGGQRGTMALVPEVVDLVAARAPGTPVLAAGGIADGRGLAAALMLGADGVLMGSRFWAAEESLVADGLVDAARTSDGDATRQSRVPDAARGLTWPDPFRIRTLVNPFLTRWAGREHEMDDDARRSWLRGMADGDARTGTPIVGEAVGLIHDRPPAADIVARILNEARTALDRIPEVV